MERILPLAEPIPRECTHCGLPLGRRPVTGTVDGEHGRFCCYGCLLAQQVTRARGESGAASSVLIRLGLAIFCTMNVMMVSMPTYVPYVYGGDAASIDGPLFQVLRVLALVFAAPVIALLGWPIVASAARGVRSGGANTDALIVLGTTAAYTLSVVNTIAGRGAVYFDTAAMLLVLVTLGRYLEARAKADAGAALQATLAPAPALAARLYGTAGRTEAVAPDALVPGDVVRVGPGDAFPTDGVVLNGTGGVDEAPVTGESRAILKEPGSAVAGGTCSLDGLFRVRVTAPAAASAAARIAALLASARRERTTAERVADRVAAVLVPLVMVVAAGAAIVWMLHEDAAHGILVGLAVLVVACPCGLGIATPVAVWTGLATAARRGVIVRSAPLLERAASIGGVFFDKTGTLTERTPRLVAVEPAAACRLSADELLARAAALEAGNPHPVARAIVAACDSARRATDGAVVVTAVRLQPGRGVRGVIEGQALAVGSLRFAAAELGPAALPAASSADGGESVVAVWTSGQLLGMLRFTETVRADAAGAIAALRRLSVRVGLLSGDTAAAVLVPSLIAASEAQVGLLPEDKVAQLRRHRRLAHDGRSSTGVAMVGDGINDAPALAAADLGIAVGSATDLARMTADVAIVADDLGRIPWLIAYARRVGRVIRQNLFWACAYNAGAVALAAAGALNPLIASLAMLGSSLAVVANARRLRSGA